MQIDEFKKIRAALDKTQKEMACLLGVSLKAIHSYEQGWRRIPHHVERQILFLFSRMLSGTGKKHGNCWDVLQCPADKLKKCPAWEFKAGDMCWFINGTICSGKAHDSWAEKIKECRSCSVFKQFFKI